ncbi:putative tricarboxylic transport membrane protein [Salinibacillus kushneri]|uniref:Putative tricarboxylic transport membrane protein n=1 Tax=Salinibacillus kushneri TaxID=237682 RepID=A0A1H9YWZ0_9BACI|nr:tripartite tricarboxylate transporter TctB family protein [Salinibacillus kushneri]SES73633.1 putative tricarboxylic transport membrane protein [Salinibacillus kushneri]
MLKRINQRIAVVLFVISAGYLIMSYQLPSFAYTAVDADVIPKGLGYLLTMLSIVLYFSKNTETEEQKERRNIPKRDMGGLLTVGGMLFLYIWLFEIIGFVLMTSLFVFFCSLILGYKKHIINALVSIIFSISTYTIFVFLLKIQLPQGILPI